MADSNDEVCPGDTLISVTDVKPSVTLNEDACSYDRSPEKESSSSGMPEKKRKKKRTPYKEYRCRFCDKFYRNKNHFEVHERSHTGERPYQCSLCNLTFRKSGNLKEHQKRHLGITKPSSAVNLNLKEHVCNICNKVFFHKVSLRRHMNTHDTVLQYHCTLCDRKFRHESTLKRHMLVELGIKRYFCDFCEKGFVEKGDMKKHMVVHTGRSEFYCSDCGKNYQRRKLLESHKCLKTNTPEKQEQYHKKIADKDYLKTSTNVNVNIEPSVDKSTEKGILSITNVDVDDDTSVNNTDTDTDDTCEQDLSSTDVACSDDSISNERYIIDIKKEPSDTCDDIVLNNHIGVTDDCHSYPYNQSESSGLNTQFDSIKSILKTEPETDITEVALKKSEYSNDNIDSNTEFSNNVQLSHIVCSHEIKPDIINDGNITHDAGDSIVSTKISEESELTVFGEVKVEEDRNEEIPTHSVCDVNGLVINENLPSVFVDSMIDTENNDTAENADDVYMNELGLEVMKDVAKEVDPEKYNVKIKIDMLKKMITLSKEKKSTESSDASSRASLTDKVIVNKYVESQSDATSKTAKKNEVIKIYKMTESASARISQRREVIKVYKVVESATAVGIPKNYEVVINKHVGSDSTNCRMSQKNEVEKVHKNVESDAANCRMSQKNEVIKVHKNVESDAANGSSQKKDGMTVYTEVENATADLRTSQMNEVITNKNAGSETDEVQAGKLFTCSRGCKMKFVSSKTYQRHLRKKHGSETGNSTSSQKNDVKVNENVENDTVSHLSEDNEVIISDTIERNTGGSISQNNESIKKGQLFDYEVAEKPNVQAVKLITCTACNVKFAFRRTYHRHLREKHGHETGNSISSQKIEVIKVNEKVENDTVSHTSQPVKLITCRGCKVKFVSRRTYQRHLREKHFVNPLMRCETCDRKIKWREVGKHKCFPCSHCKKIFQKSEELRTHIGNMIKCRLCKKSFCHKLALRKHEKSEHFIGNHVCKICELAFLTTDLLDLHDNKVHAIHDDKPFRCRICKIGYTCSANFRKHCNLHQGKFVCSGCQKKFCILQSLERHYKNHKECGKSAGMEGCKDNEQNTAVGIRHPKISNTSNTSSVAIGVKKNVSETKNASDIDSAGEEELPDIEDNIETARDKSPSVSDNPHDANTNLDSDKRDSDSEEAKKDHGKIAESDANKTSNEDTCLFVQIEPEYDKNTFDNGPLDITSALVISKNIFGKPKVKTIALTAQKSSNDLYQTVDKTSHGCENGEVKVLNKKQKGRTIVSSDWKSAITKGKRKTALNSKSNCLKKSKMSDFVTSVTLEASNQIDDSGVPMVPDDNNTSNINADNELDNGMVLGKTVTDVKLEETIDIGTANNPDSNSGSEFIKASDYNVTGEIPTITDKTESRSSIKTELYRNSSSDSCRTMSDSNSNSRSYTDVNSEISTNNEERTQSIVSDMSDSNTDSGSDSESNSDGYEECTEEEVKAMVSTLRS